MTVSRSSPLQKRYVSDKSCRENQNTVYVQHLFSGNGAVYETMLKSMVQSDSPQMTVQQGACAVRAGSLKQEYRDTVVMCSTYCFCTAKMVWQTHLDVTLYENCLEYYFGEFQASWVQSYQSIRRNDKTLG
jgi:hypothetical protein